MTTSQRKPPKLSDDEILSLLGDKVCKIRYSVHALERLDERDVLPEAVEQMLRGLTSQRFREPRKDRFEMDYWKYMIKGEDLDGNIISVVLFIEENEVFIVTVFKDE